MNEVLSKIKDKTEKLTKVIKEKNEETSIESTESKYGFEEQRNQFVQKINEELGKKPRTEYVEIERLNRKENLSKEEINNIKVIANIFKNIHNYPDDKKIDKPILEDIRNTEKGEIPEYEINVDTNGDIIVQIKDGLHLRLNDDIANDIYKSGALKNEREMATAFQYETKKLFERYRSFFGDGKKELRDMNEVEREEYTLVSEEIIRTLKNFKIHEHGKSINIGIKSKEDEYIATRSDKKARIQLTQDQKEIVKKIQNDLINDKVLQIMSKKHLETYGKVGPLTSMDKSYLIYCELRDLGINIESCRNKKLRFVFPFGDELEVDNNNVKSWVTNIPYTKKMINSYEESYRLGYNPAAFFRYTRGMVEEDVGYKMRDRKLKKIKANLRIADKKLTDLEEKQFKSQPKIQRDNLSFVANTVTLGQSKKHIRGVNKFLEENKKIQRLRRKEQKEDAIIDWLMEKFFIKDKKAELNYILKIQEQRRAQEVAGFMKDNERWEDIKATHENIANIDITDSMINRAKKELGHKKPKMIGFKFNEQER